MALTPEDVVNKRFQPTKFREGYDQDEVDDFLDEVVVELRRLNQENEELRQRLMQADARINQLQSAPPQQQAPQMAPPPQAAPPQPAPAFAAAAAPNADAMDPGNTNNLLQLARTLHEQHVREGMEKRDALIAEGQAAAARAVQEAEAQQRSALGGLEQERQALEQERQALEASIEELRNFERDYRVKLKGYIEGQLRELDATSVVSQQAAPQQAAPQQTGPQQFAAQPAPEAAPNGYDAPAPAYGAPAYGAAPQAPQAPQGYPGFAGQ
jgi:DivIVA domain-containing protein